MSKIRNDVLLDLSHLNKMWESMWHEKDGKRQFWEYVRAFAETELKDLDKAEGK